MGKRKRGSASQQAIADGQEAQYAISNAEKPPAADQGKRRKAQGSPKDAPLEPVTIQIVAGTYEKVLHGLTATITRPLAIEDEKPTEVEFADTFMFNAHSSAVRCLAISPNTKNSDKVILASGGSDQLINLYSISTIPPSHVKTKAPLMPTLAGNRVVENPKNKELGSLQHHAGSINALHFPTRSKLLSAAEDNTMAVTRTRDWTVLSTIKAPIPKLYGRPSGDMAPLSGAPSGINDVAVHPSLKLMLSVGKGEKCMRLWNLITGRKAAVLNFDRHLLHSVGEGKYNRGEGWKVEWNHLGEEFALAFERACVIYGIDSKPKCLILPSPKTKVHQMKYLTLKPNGAEPYEVLSLSTEDGRMMFYSTKYTVEKGVVESHRESSIPVCEPLGLLGGPTEGLTGRIKDFEILSVPHLTNPLIVTGSSDGAIRLWLVNAVEIARQVSSPRSTGALVNGHSDPDVSTARKRNLKQVGHLLSTYETGNRITCLKAFVMSGPVHPETVIGGKTSLVAGSTNGSTDVGKDS
ncbi:MAG: hypothetical protein Q9163_000935 [Psora crenata]